LTCHPAAAYSRKNRASVRLVKADFDRDRFPRHRNCTKRALLPAALSR
jgi:hypothetical protein